jgi:hypothetical protein
MKSASTIKRPAPLSIRLNDAERDDLLHRANGEALSSYVKRCVFGKRSFSGRMSQEQVALLLAKLASCGLAGSLSDLSEAAKLGVLPVTSDTEQALRQACTDIADMRLILLQSLGKRL